MLDQLELKEDGMLAPALRAASSLPPRGDILALQPVHRSRWTACRRGSAAPPTMVLEENVRVSGVSPAAQRGGKAPQRTSSSAGFGIHFPLWNRPGIGLAPTMVANTQPLIEGVSHRLYNHSISTSLLAISLLFESIPENRTQNPNTGASGGHESG